MFMETIYRVINDNIAGDTEVTSANFSDDLVNLGMDSIAFIKVIVDLEEQLAVEIPDDFLLLNEMNTVEKISRVLSSLL